MRRIKKLGVLCALLSITIACKSQTMDQENIKQTITAFSKAGDSNNDKELGNHLDSNYRVVMNRLFGSKEVSVVSKSEYLKKIKTKEWGGDSRKLTFENIVINGTTASAKVIFKGKKSTIASILILVKDEKGIWKLVNDTPIFK